MKYLFTLFDTRWFTIWFRLYTTSFRSILIKQRISENYLLQRLLKFKIIVKNQIFLLWNSLNLYHFISHFPSRSTTFLTNITTSFLKFLTNHCATFYFRNIKLL